MRMMLSLAEGKSMTATAKKLHVTQPALTYQLNTIESELGFKVFNRTRTGTSLTPEGEFLIGAIGDFVADYEKALRLARAMARSDGEACTSSVVIGTVMGDRHDIGKNLVRIELEGRDVEVADLGTEVPTAAFVEHVRNTASCKVVLVSVSRTDLLENAAEIVSALQAEGLRKQVFIMVGGAAASPQFASESGMDAYTATAEEAADRACAALNGKQA